MQYHKIFTYMNMIESSILLGKNGKITNMAEQTIQVNIISFSHLL